MSRFPKTAKSSQFLVPHCMDVCYSARDTFLASQICPIQ